MTSSHKPLLLAKDQKPFEEYSFIEALSLAPRDSLSLVSKEALGLEPSPSLEPPPRFPTPPNATAAKTVPPVPTSTAVVPRYALVPPRSATVRKPRVMAPVSKAQTQCIELCQKTSKTGDRISVRCLEYLTSVKELPEGLDALAHGLLDTCQILFALESGLEECSRRSRSFPPADMIAELDKKLRVTQADFHLLDQLLGKFLEYERKGKVGRMRRGWGKIFGDDDFEKMAATLARAREMLRTSVVSFKWTFGNEKADSVGIGYTGLAAALNRLDERAGVSSKINLDRPVSPLPQRPITPVAPHVPSHAISHTPSSHYPSHLSSHVPSQAPSHASHAYSHASHSTSHVPTHNRGLEALQPPLPPLPWSERSSSFHNDGAPSLATHSVVDPRQPFSPLPHQSQHYTATSASSIASHERIASGANGFDRASAFDESLSHSGASETDGLLEDVAGVEIPASKVVRLQADPFTMPRWAPRNTANPESGNLKGALLAAIRGKNHKLVEQLLDRGVSANTGPEVQALREAIRAHDNESVRILLLFGADPNEADKNGVSPLLAAVENSLLASAITLLKYGADPNFSAGPDLESPLAASTIANKIGISHLLLIYGGDSNHFTTEGNTLLIAAINKKTPKIFIELLLDYGADPNAKSREGKTALFEAIQCGRADIVTSLLDHGANPNLPGPKHMLWPATYQSPCLQILLSHGADYKKTPGIMELATSINNIESVRILLKAGVDPNAKKDGVYTPLCTSIRDDRPDLFNLLLSNKANPNVPASEYPAFKCVTHNRLHFLPPLVAAGADLNSPKGILETAVSFNNMEALTWLLDQGLNPNDRNPKGASPLTSAIRDNRIEMVDLLISRGADVHVRGENWPVCMAVKNPPMLKRILAVLSEPRAFKGVMEMAVVADQLESVKLLLAAGVSVEDKNGGVFSPLTSAIREDRQEIVVFLLNEGGADVNAPGEHLPIVKALRRRRGDDVNMIKLLLDKGADPNNLYRGWNAMMQAIENGDLTVLTLLTERSGVDMSVKDDLGRTVMDMASSRGWDEAVEILKNAGPKK